jgi:glycosyltransferase involved in cell wall biosynthesis
MFTVSCVVCVTDSDAEVVRAEIPGADIVVVPNAHAEVPEGPGFEQRTGFLFVGNFNHPPNADAVAWWKRDIAPLLAETRPQTELTVIGNDPMGTARELAGPGITVGGAVVSTLPYLHQARVSVAPLRYGAGMKSKVGEALAAGIPVVLTSVAAEGMGLVHEEHVLIADTADDFAAAVQRLYDDPELWERLRQAGAYPCGQALWPRSYEKRDLRHAGQPAGDSSSRSANGAFPRSLRKGPIRHELEATQ